MSQSDFNARLERIKNKTSSPSDGYVSMSQPTQKRSFGGSWSVTRVLSAVICWVVGHWASDSLRYANENYDSLVADVIANVPGSSALQLASGFAAMALLAFFVIWGLGALLMFKWGRPSYLLIAAFFVGVGTSGFAARILAAG